MSVICGIRTMVRASLIMMMLISVSEMKPQQTTPREECKDILKTPTCLEIKGLNECENHGGLNCRKTCGFCSPSDSAVCRLITHDKCSQADIKEECPLFCSEPVSDSAVCRLITHDKCSQADIKEECPLFCSEPVSDSALCHLISHDKCSQKDIKEECPIFCSEPVSDSAVCRLISHDKCSEMDIKEECPLFCSEPVSAIPSIQCPVSEGFILSPGGKQCFKGFPELGLIWTGAENHCQTNGGLVLASPYDGAWLQKALDEKYGDVTHNHWWISARGNGSVFTWRTRGNQILETNSPYWYPGNPENFGFDTSRCVVMTSYATVIATHPGKPYLNAVCSEHFRYPLCERIME